MFEKGKRNFTDEDMDTMVNYIHAHWYDPNNYSDLNLFLDKGYEDLAIRSIVWSGAIDSNLCYEHVKEIEKLIETYYEQEIKGKDKEIEKQLEECLADVTCYTNSFNETQFISKELHSISPQELHEWGYFEDDFDPTPWCAACGAQLAKQCKCGPVADND